MNSREPHDAGCDDILALDFKIVKEVDHRLQTEIVNIQLRYGALFLPETNRSSNTNVSR